MFTVPQLDPTYKIKAEDQEILDFVNKKSTSSPQNILITGLHGCGKSELAKNFAAAAKKPFYELSCAFYREPRDFFGYKAAKDGTTYWNKSLFVEAVSTPNSVILLDEINRCSSSVLNSLFPLLDDRRECWFDDLGKIEVAEGVIFVATMNKGNVYTGTLPSDRALLDRFAYAIEMTYLEPESETNVLIERCGVDNETASGLVKIANLLREKYVGLGGILKETISTRVLIATAHLYKEMGEKAFQYTVYPLYSAAGRGSSERAAVMQVIQLFYGRSAEPTKKSQF